MTLQPLATGQTGDGVVSDLALYYLNNTSVRSLENMSSYFAMLGDIEPGILSSHLGQLLNSYLLLSQASTSVISPSGQAFEPINTIPITATNLMEVYIISWPWVLVFLLATATLIFTAIAGVILHHVAISPEYSAT